MGNSKFNIFKSEYLKNVSFMFFFYWFVLVVWQNISGAETRGTVDTILKIGLLSLLVVFFLFNFKTVSLKIVLVMSVASLLSITLINESGISLAIIVSYVFPILYLTLTYGIGDDFEINKTQLIGFLNCVIILVLYMAGYSYIFCWDKFQNAFSITSAYGNELSAFFSSSHEYGMYLTYAITGCMICLNLKKSEGFGSKIPYILAIIVFLPNLILTYSRTSIAGALLVFVIFAFFNKGSSLKKWILFFVVVGILLVVFVPKIQTFVLDIVFKSNNAADRDKLYNIAFDYFESGSISEKIFGRGVIESNAFIEKETLHSSVHNAYLQILIYYGISGLVLLVMFLGVQMIECLKLLKKDSFMGAMHMAILVSAMAMMFTNTSMIFNSPIDSYFLTVFAITIPKYVRNSINAEKFYNL